MSKVMKFTSKVMKFKVKFTSKVMNFTHMEIASAHRLAMPIMNMTPMPREAPDDPETIPKIVMMLSGAMRVRNWDF